MDVSSIALQELEQASAQLEATASAIANAGSSSASGVDTVDLSAEMAALISAQSLFSANVATLKTADQTQQNVLDLSA
jgi:flagellar hook protein FlgE